MSKDYNYNEIKQETHIDEIINSVLDKLADIGSLNSSIYLSEADFQFSFAQKLAEIIPEDKNKIILEYPILTKKLYSQSDKCKNCIIKSYKDSQKAEIKYVSDRSYIDLCFHYDNKDYYVEFKYKLDDICNIQRYSCKTNIKKQGAEYIGRHHIYEDIERMENILKIKNQENTRAYVILVTNDRTYWEINQEKEEQTTYDFPLAEKRKNTKCITDCRNGYECLHYNSKQDNSPRDLYIEHSYKLYWKPFISLSNVKNKIFKVLIINCNKYEV